MKCKGKNKTGKKCGANAMDNGYCYKHNPDITEEEKLASVVKGGKVKQLIISEPYGEIQLDSIKSISKFLAMLINETLQSKMDLRLATGLTYISNSLLKALELSDLESRINNVEEMLNEYKQRKNA